MSNEGHLLPLFGLPPTPEYMAPFTAFFAVCLIVGGMTLARTSSKRDLAEQSPSGLGSRSGSTVLGLILLWIGLCFASAPMLPGTVSHGNACLARVVRCLVAPGLFGAERFLVSKKPLPPLQTFATVVVWVSATLWELGAPRPYEDISMVLDQEVMGCNGGYRFWFTFYVTTVLTGAAIAVSLLFVPETAGADGEEVTPYTATITRLRRKLMPFVYGAGVTAGGMCFNLGVASARRSFIFVGFFMLAMCVLFAADYVVRQGLSLASWAAASQLFLHFLAYLQMVCVFQDLRWADPTEEGMFALSIDTGVWYVAAGVCVFFLAFPVYIEADDSVEFFCEYDEEEREARKLKTRTKTSIGQRRPARTLAVFILIAAAITVYLGVTLPMLSKAMGKFQVSAAGDGYSTLTKTTTEHPDEGKPAFQAIGKGFLYMLPNFFLIKMPITSVVVIKMCLADPLQLIFMTVIVLVRPAIVPEPMTRWCRNVVVGGAKSRFINPMVQMTAVAFINFWDPTDGILLVGFSTGFWFITLHAIVCCLLSVAVEVDAEKLDRIDPQLEGFKYAPVASPNDGETTADDVPADSPLSPRLRKARADNSMLIMSFIFILFLIVTYVGLVNPFLYIQVRIGGAITSRIGATGYKLYNALMDTNQFLGVLASTSIFGAVIVWVPLVLLCIKFADHRELLITEKIARRSILTPQWSGTFLFLYLILSMRAGDPNAIIQFCYEVPSVPIGPLALVVMMVAVGVLMGMTNKLLPHNEPLTVPPSPGGIKIPRLPGGLGVWGLFAGALWVGLFLYFCITGPGSDNRFKNLADVNAHLAHTLPTINDGLSSKVPFGIGDCPALQSKMQNEGKSFDAKKCIGKKPIANSTEHSMHVAMKWVTGLDSIKIQNLKVLPPSDPTADSRKWRFIINAVFQKLRVWLKVDLVGSVMGREVFDRVWFDDNMCCTSPINFTIRAAASCTDKDGFHEVHVDIPYLDWIYFTDRKQDGTAMEYLDEANMKIVRLFEAPYKAALLAALNSLFDEKQEQLRVQTNDVVINPMEFIAKEMEQALVINTGHKCPRGDTELD